MRPRGSAIADLWSGLASMLVVLPASIAFGSLVYAPFGPQYAAAGAAAGIIGSIVLGVVAPILGGTRRLVSGPCAPAAAVLAAFALQLAGRGIPPEHALLLIALASLLGGAFQFLFGAIGGGRLIKFIPYPVAAGYLSGVSLLIVLSQLPKLLGLAHGASLSGGILRPELWSAPSLIIGAATMGATLLGPRLSKKIPPSILGLLAGIAAFLALSAWDRRLFSASDNPLLIGAIPSAGPEAVGAALRRWADWDLFTAADFRLAAGPAVTLSILLSIDTLKTCVFMDSLNEARHDSNRELAGQGVANFASALCGGLSGAGQMGATLVNISGGAQTDLSAVLEGLFCLLVFAFFGRLIAWLPVAALAGILIVVAHRMFDYNVFSLLKQRSTRFDFVVTATVIVVAAFAGLMVAAGVGVALAILVFMRQQMSGSVIRRRTYGDRFFSKQQRLASEMKVLEAHGDRTVICQLQGSLFFGTADQLYTELEEDLARREFIILDMRRIQSVDLTAAHVLRQMGARLAKRRAFLIFSGLPARLPSGLRLANYFDQLGLVQGKKSARVFPELDDALAWAEGRILAEEHVPPPSDAPLGIAEVDMLHDFEKAPMNLLRSCLEEMRFPEGASIFKQGDPGDQLFIIRKGRVRIMLPLSDARGHHIATFAQGDSFGEVAFLDGGMRSADALADADTELFVLSRRRFDEAVKDAPRLAGEIFSRLARTLALRLRTTNAELTALQDE